VLNIKKSQLKTACKCGKYALPRQTDMIKKKKYLEILDNILETEDDVTEHFYKYTTDSLKYYKWLSEDQREQIDGITTKLRDDCKKHKVMVEKLIKHVQESEENVF
jgi:hypothetical protein